MRPSAGLLVAMVPLAEIAVAAALPTHPPGREEM